MLILLRVLVCIIFCESSLVAKISNTNVRMTDDAFGFHTWSEGQTTYYGTENLYEFASRELLRGVHNGVERSIADVEAQMSLDIGRTGTMPIVLNGRTPASGTWTKDSFVSALRSILGDGWERWNAVMYRPFCVVLSQTIMARGMTHFQQSLLHGDFALAGASGSGHSIRVNLDPTSGAVDLEWRLRTNIVPLGEAGRTVVGTNILTVRVQMSPTSEGRYTGSIQYAMDQSELFASMVERGDRILLEAARRVEKPQYSTFHTPVSVARPSKEMEGYFQGLADRILSVLALRERFPDPPTPPDVLPYIRSRLTPYSLEGSPIYSIEPKFGDMYVAYLVLMKETIAFLNVPNPALIRFTKLAQNATSHREGVYGIRQLLEQSGVYMLLRVGTIPRIRVRSSPYVSLFTANERYRMERNAERTGTPAYQPATLTVEKTGEILPKPLSAVASRMGFLGGGRHRTKVQKHRHHKKRTVKARKVHTRGM